MQISIVDLLDGLEQIAPSRLAESWDNVGLLIGDPLREIRGLLLGLDPTLSLLEEALHLGVDTLLTHHPCIFRPLSSVHVNTPDGAFLERALHHKINVIACHTNYDSAVTGVSDALAILLGLKGLTPLRRLPGAVAQGLGRIGDYQESLPYDVFMGRVFEALGTKSVQVTGTHPARVRRVALCGGSGSDFAQDALQQGADVYLSSEIKHSTARWAEDSGFCIIDATHYDTEKPAMALLGTTLEVLARHRGWEIEIHQSTSEKPAFTRLHKNDFSREE